MHALRHQTKESWRFLIEEKEVAYLAAADVLSVVQTRDPARIGKGLLAFGDPAGTYLPQALDPAQPGRSYIQLAPGTTPEAARLTVGEVYCSVR